MQGVFKFVSGIHGVLMLPLSFCSGWFCQHDTIYKSLGKGVLERDCQSLSSGHVWGRGLS